MTYVIVSTCIDVKDGACQEACPVECIYEGGRMMYIQPAECIDCGLCLSVWGSPGGADSAHVSALDHPLVTMRDRRRRSSPHNGDVEGIG